MEHTPSSGGKFLKKNNFDLRFADRQLHELYQLR